jgi:hypothetical protein
MLSQLSTIDFQNVHGKSINKTTKLIIRLIEISEVCTKIITFEEYHGGTTNLYRNHASFLFSTFFANCMLHGQWPTLVSSCKYTHLCLQLLFLSNSRWSFTKVRGFPNLTSYTKLKYENAST